MSAPELTAEELATVARFEQAPDALGLREEVAPPETTGTVAALVQRELRARADHIGGPQ